MNFLAMILGAYVFVGVFFVVMAVREDRLKIDLEFWISAVGVAVMWPIVVALVIRDMCR